MTTRITDLSIDGFERVVELADPQAGLLAFVGLHSLALGPGLGGCRMFDYRSRDAALSDVCNLARGMSYKNALADISFGGGKSVIVGDPATKTPELLRAFAAGLNALKGDYLSAEDSGITPADMALIGQHSAFVAGAGSAGADQGQVGVTGNGGGNPAPFTAQGVFLGLKAAVAHRLGGCFALASQTRPLNGLKVGIEGLGQVGYELARLLSNEGAQIVATELDAERAAQATTALNVRVVARDQLFARDLDVFAPCAMGGAVSLARLPQMRAPVIAGAANNQLENVALGDLLAQRGQLYAPDYVINAAGVISIAGEYLGCWSPQWVAAKVEQIPTRLTRIFARARATGQSTAMVADRCAREAIRAGKGLLATQAVTELRSKSA